MKNVGSVPEQASEARLTPPATLVGSLFATRKLDVIPFQLITAMIARAKNKRSFFFYPFWIDGNGVSRFFFLLVVILF